MDRIYKVSVERCIACGKCELACAFAHGSEGKPAKTRISIFRRGPELGTPVVCFQCHDAACVAICPTAALVRNAATGAVDMARMEKGAVPLLFNHDWSDPIGMVDAGELRDGRLMVDAHLFATARAKEAIGASEDLHEGLRAFFEKREPKWIGR